MASGRIIRRLLLGQNIVTNFTVHAKNYHSLFNYVSTKNVSKNFVFSHLKLTICEERFSACHVQIRHKGHSHFQNIRANKMANDGARMRVMSKLSSDMAIAVREPGGYDPKLNSKLAGVMSKMDVNNIPKAKILGVLEKLKEAGKNQQNLMVEVRGPKGSVFVTELFALNPKSAKDQVRAAVKKLPGTKVSDQPSWIRQFDQVGMITVPVTSDMDASNMDQYVEVAIESGAEDVILTKNTDESIEADTVLKFHCDPKLLHKVEKEITETHDLKVLSAEVDLIPHVWEIFDTEDDIKVYEAILVKLNNIEDVIKISDNVSVPEE